MARPNHQIRQPATHQNYIGNHTRNISQGSYHQRGPRHAQPRNVVNRNNHEGMSTHVIGISNEPGNSGQPSSVMFPPQHVNANGPRPPMFVTGQITPNIHSSHNNNPQQAPMFPINNQMSQIPFSAQPGPSTQSQQYIPGYTTPIILSHHIFPFPRSPHPQLPPYCVQAPSQSQFPTTQINVNPTPSAHSHPPVVGGNDVSSQVIHSKHNISPPTMSIQNHNSANNNCKKIRTRPNALMNIIDPATGRNIAEDIYRNASTSPPVKNEQLSTIGITNPNFTQHNKPQKVFPKLSITISPSSTLSTTMTSSHSESLSPVPLSTSSRANSPDKSSIDINSHSETQVSSNNEGDHNVKAVDKSDYIESLVISSNSHYNYNRPLTSVPEEHYFQSQAVSQNNGKSSYPEDKSGAMLEEPVQTEENRLEEKKSGVEASPETVGPSKSNNGKSQKKKNKRRSKNRDLNRNQVQNSSTSSEESTSNARVESSKQNLEETKPTVIPEIKEEESALESITPTVCDQNNVKSEPGVKHELEDPNKSTIKVKIEQLINDQDQDLKPLELSKENCLVSSAVKTEKCDIKIEAPSLENLVKSEEESIKDDFSSQETFKSINILNINNEPIEIPGDIFSFEATNSCIINDGSDQCYIRGANGINFFFSEMSEDIVQLNQNQPLEQQIHNESQNIQQNDNNEFNIEQQNDIQSELEHQQDIEIKLEPQEDVEIESELQKDTNIELEQEINNEVDPEQQKDNEIDQELTDCREFEEKSSVIHRIDETPEPQNDKHEEQRSNVEIKHNEKQNDNILSEKIKIEEKRRFIKPPAYEHRRASLDDIPERKMYSPEFLMSIKDNEQCWTRPSLPDVYIVKHNVKRPSQNSSAVLSSREKSHEFLLPGFSKPAFSSKAAPTNRRSFQGKSKPHKQNIIHVSLSLNEDIKLRRTENAWKPSPLQRGKSKEGNNEDIVLFKKVRSVLNKLTPEKFDSLVEQVKELEINSLQQLEGIIDILFQKAIDEPLYSNYYALMCKELSDKSTAENEKKEKKMDFRKLVIESCQREFERNLTDENEQNEKAQKIEHYKDDDKQKKKLELELEEERSKSKRRCLGNIKFVGELYKQEMITCKTMMQCIESLLNNSDEESLESLCKLLITIGKLLEEKKKLDTYFTSLKQLIDKKSKIKLSPRIRFMIQDIIELRENKWVPRRKENNPQTMGQIQREVETERVINDAPAPPQSYSSQKEFVTPRKDVRDNTNDRRRNCARISSNIDENGWSSVRSNRHRPSASLTIQREKLNVKPPPVEETTLGSRSSFIFNRTAESKPIIVAPNKYASLDNIMKSRRSSIASSDPPKEFRPEFKLWTDGSSSRCENQRMSLGPMPTRDSLSMPSSVLPMSRTPTPPSSSSSPTFVPISRTPTPPTPSPTSLDERSNNLPIDENKLRNLVKSLLDESSSSDVDLFMKNAQETIEDKFGPQSYPLLIEEALNSVLERTQIQRQRFSTLLAQLIKDEIIPLSVFQIEFKKLLEIADDLVIDIPRCWKYFAEILMEMVATNAHPFIELTRTLATLRKTENCGKLLGELLSILAKEKTPKWVIDNWNQSGLDWTDLINSDCIHFDDILKKYNLEFLVEGINNNSGELSESRMTLEHISEYLLKLLEENNFDNITSWISLNVGEQSKQPPFVRCLVTNILKTSIEAIDDSWRLKSDTFSKLLPLITRYVDAQRELELQCLYAIQAYNHELMYPQGVLSKIVDRLCEQGVLSDEAYIEWWKTDNPSERNGHGIAIKALTSFFTKLGEAEHDDSSE